MGYKVAVMGATGNVGRELIAIMAERNFPADEVVALASERSVGREISFGEKKILKVQQSGRVRLSPAPTSCLSSPGASVSAQVHRPRPPPPAPWLSTIPRISAWSRTSRWWCRRSIPGAIAGYTKRGIIANPNCSTIQMVVALKPLA